eukprot:g11777.t1
MVVGTAGFTAMACILALERRGNLQRGRESHPVLVTGATGGVGGHRPKSVAGVLPAQPRARDVIGRLSSYPQPTLEEPLGEEIYAGVVETTGGGTGDLAAALSMVQGRKAVALCGRVGGTELRTSVFPFIAHRVGGTELRTSVFPFIARRVGGTELRTSVFPFITRGVKLLGFNNRECPRQYRKYVWEEVGRCVPKEVLKRTVTTHSLEELAGDLGPRLLAGELKGRNLIDLSWRRAQGAQPDRPVPRESK